MEIAKALLAAHADANARTTNGLTALAIASQKGHSQFVQLLKSSNLVTAQAVPAQAERRQNCSTSWTIQLETFGEGVTVELRQGVPGTSKVLGTEHSSGGTVFFRNLVLARFF